MKDVAMSEVEFQYSEKWTCPVHVMWRWLREDIPDPRCLLERASSRGTAISGDSHHGTRHSPTRERNKPVFFAKAK